ncbi:MAG: hypothetical protein ACRC1K_18515 [Planctomycetia bacterium]
MTGRVDGELRAVPQAPSAASSGGPRQEVKAWVDTAFNGGLALPRELAAQLGLALAATTEALLADGTKVELEAYRCWVDRFGDTYRTEVLVGDARRPF